MEDARKLITDFVTGTERRKTGRAKTLFAASIRQLNAQRDKVMNGIERFSRKQNATAEDIREETQKMRELQDKPNCRPGPGPRESCHELGWQTPFSRTGRKSTSYVCDVPVLIEKRLFDLGERDPEAS